MAELGTVSAQIKNFMFKFLGFLMASAGLLAFSVAVPSVSDADVQALQSEHHACVSHCEQHDGVECPSEREKSCYMCYGTGVCRTCNGKGYFYSEFGTGTIECPNCTDGSCRTCGGTGKI